LEKGGGDKSPRKDFYKLKKRKRAGSQDGSSGLLLRGRDHWTRKGGGGVSNSRVAPVTRTEAKEKGTRL